MPARIYSRFQSFIICILVYVAALAVAAFFIYYTKAVLHPLLAALLADVLATVVVFVFSLLFKNASLYDPYWSVAPPVIACYWMMAEYNFVSISLLAVISLWAIRLTLNWARGWSGLAHQDWRYIMLHDKNPSLYWLTNFGGIHMFPTLMVFAGMLPVYYALTTDTIFSRPLFIAGLAITVTATLIELIADEQMKAFKKTAQKGEYIQTGLWKYSRHPNYFGEITFWFGLWVSLMGVAPQYWWTGVGFIAMTVMFVFASIPMMEQKNLKSKPGYAKYVKEVSMLVPWLRGNS